MELTAEERAMLNGELGGPVKRAIEMQIEVGRFYGAKRFVPSGGICGLDALQWGFGSRG